MASGGFRCLGKLTWWFNASTQPHLRQLAWLTAVIGDSLLA